METSRPGFWGKPHLVASLVVSLLLPLLGAAAIGWRLYLSEWEDARTQALSYARTISQFVSLTLDDHLRLHEAVRVRAESRPDDVTSRGFHEFLSVAETTQAVSFGLALMTSGGRVIASSREYPVDVEIGRRAYLDAVRDGAPVFIDRLILQPGGHDAIAIASPLQVPGFDGAIVSSLDLKPIEQFLTGLAAEGHFANVLRADGKLLVLSNGSGPLQLPPEAPFFVHRDEAPTTYRAVSAADGVERLFSLVPGSTPSLYFAYGTPVSEITRAWLRASAPYWAIFAGIGAVTALALRLLRQRVAERVRIFAAERRREVAENIAAQQARLVSETHHRVRNNLALIASLVRSQMRQKGVVDGAEIQARIQAIAEVHDLMYSSDTPGEVDFGRALERIARSAAIVPAETGIAVRCESAPGIFVTPDQMTPLALVAAELITNAVKHAFAEREPGRIEVKLRREGGYGVLDIGDDGVGLPPATQRHSGMQIIEALVDQLGGTLDRRSEPGKGAAFRLRFPLADTRVAAAAS